MISALLKTGRFMQITRTQHLSYMAKMTPLLLFLYVLQALLYYKFAPIHMVTDINLFLGVGLAAIILSFHFYDLHHKVLMYQNYMEVRFDVLKMKEEILYQNIKFVEVRKKKHNYADLILHLRDGSFCHLHHVDSPEVIVDFIERKKTKRPRA